MDLARKAKKLLKQAFPPPSKVSIEDDKGLIGLVVSPSFRGLDSIDRQQLVWDALDEKLSPEERKRIVIVVAVTPEEETMHLASSPLPSN